MAKDKQQSPFGKRLKEAFAGASNVEIGKKLGLSSKSAVTNYMQGRIPELEILLKISQIANCSLHWLITGEGSKYVLDGADAEMDSRIDLDDNETIYIQRIADFEGKDFDEVVRELVIEALSLRSAQLFTDYRKMEPEQLDKLLAKFLAGNNNGGKRRRA